MQTFVLGLCFWMVMSSPVGATGKDTPALFIGIGPAIEFPSPTLSRSKAGVKGLLSLTVGTSTSFQLTWDEPMQAGSIGAFYILDDLPVQAWLGVRFGKDSLRSAPGNPSLGEFYAVSLGVFAPLAPPLFWGLSFDYACRFDEPFFTPNTSLMSALLGLRFW